MAIVATHLTTSGDTTDGTSYGTESISPAVDRLVLFWLSSTRTGAPPSSPGLSGCSLTWVEATNIAWPSANRILFLFRALGTPTAGVVTMDWGAETQLGVAWSVSDVGGVDTGGTNGSAAIVQTATATDSAVTSLIITLGAFGSGDNATAGGFIHDTNEATVQGTGFTLLGSAGHANPNRGIGSEWRADNATSVDASWASSSNCGGIAVEIKAAPPPPAASLIHTPQPLHAMIGR